MSARDLQKRLARVYEPHQGVDPAPRADEVTVTVTLTVPAQEVPRATREALAEMARAILREARESRRRGRKRRDD